MDKAATIATDQIESTLPAPAVTADAPPSPAWVTQYEHLLSKAPPSLASRLPTSSQASSVVDRLATISKSGRAKFDELRGNGVSTFQGVESKFSREQFFGHAYSITNGTDVDLNVSLNQVGPLMYEVLAPGATFERRVPNVWYSIEVRPYTDPSSAYSPWSVAWPVLAVTGPVVAATSLIAIPLIAIAMGPSRLVSFRPPDPTPTHSTSPAPSYSGGTTLAALTGFSSSVTASAGAVVSSASAVSASAASLALKASHLPGGSKLKAKLVDAAKKNLMQGKDVVQERVVGYFMEAAAAAGGAVGLKDSEVMRKRRAEMERKVRERKLVEVEVTGLDLQKVLRCQTGKKKVDKALSEAFKKLAFKEKSFKTSSNPVLVIVGGPELEDRGTKQYLIFYPFLIQPLPSIFVQPLPASEVPPTEEEAKFILDAHVVETVEEAEKVVQKVPVYGEGEGEKRTEGEKVVEEVREDKGKGVERKRSWWGFGGPSK